MAGNYLQVLWNLFLLYSKDDANIIYDDVYDKEYISSLHYTKFFCFDTCNNEYFQWSTTWWVNYVNLIKDAPFWMSGIVT